MDTRVQHLHHCISYKKLIMKVLDSCKLPLELDKYIFTFVGFYPISFVRDYIVSVPVSLRSKE